jgi:TolB-like protein
MEDYMRGRVAITGAVLTAVAAMFLNCSPKVKTSIGSKIKNMAVVEAEVDAESDASASLNKAEVRQITAVLRKEAVKNLPQGKYNIMTTETVMSQGSAVLEECSDENCVIKVGAAIGADYIVRGTVSKFGTMLTVSVDMYETNDGNLVASSELVRSENIVELLDRTAAASGEMYRKFENPKSVSVKQTTYTIPAALEPQSAANNANMELKQTTYTTPVAPKPQPTANNTNRDKNRERAEDYKIRLYGLIEQNKVKEAYKRFNKYRKPLNKFLDIQDFQMLEITVMQSYEQAVKK